jgi:hypothetical protein
MTYHFGPQLTDFPLAINPLELRPGENANLKTSALVEMFEVLAGQLGGRASSTAKCAAAPHPSAQHHLAGFATSPDNPSFCQHLLDSTRTLNCTVSLNRNFWCRIQTRQEHIAPILNKVGPLLTLPLLRNIFGQPRSKFSFENACRKQDRPHLALKRQLGEDCSHMLGMILFP